jgi:hypothetical protein
MSEVVRPNAAVALTSTGAGRSRVRLRQAVLAVSELEPAAAAPRSALNLNEPFRDPNVGLFGLANVVFAVNDCFVEVVSPTRPDTVASRYLERHGGDGGEVHFETAASERAEGLVEIALELPHELPGGREAIELGGVRVRRVDITSAEERLDSFHKVEPQVSQPLGPL